MRNRRWSAAVAMMIGTALAGAAGAAPPVMSDQVKVGVDAWEAGNYTRAVQVWRPLAEQGDADAQFNLAQAYRLGRGGPIDMKAAESWYQKAAQQDHYQAQANYGLLLFQGGRRSEAMPWLEKAANKGDPRAQYVVGTALFNGEPLPKDWVRAYALMTRASAAGLPPAATSLAEMDRYLSLEQRQQGTALARDLERTAALTGTGGPSPEWLVRARGQSPQPAEQATASARPAPAPVAPPVLAAAVPAPMPKPVPPRAVPRTEPAPTAPPRAAAPPRPAAPARAEASAPRPLPVAAGGGWRVQVGAYANPAAAGSVWDGIARKTPGLGLRSYLVKAGAVTRLQAGPLASRADASRACARITAASGTPCFPVAAR